MSGGWVKIANELPEVLEHKTVLLGLPPLSDRAFRLYITAMCFSSKALSDGVVPAVRAKRLTATANKRVVQELVAADLLEETDSGDYLVHDYLDYNPSRAEIRDRREKADADRAAAAKRKRDQRARSHGNVTRDITQDTPEAADRDPRTRDRTGTRRTGLSHSNEEEETFEENVKDKPKETELQKATQQQLTIVDTLAEQIRQRDPKASIDPRSENWLKESRLLLTADKRTFDEIMAVLAWLPTHQGNDFAWGAVVLSMGKLRKQFTTLVAAMGTGNGHRQSAGGRRPRNDNRSNERITGDLDARNEASAAWLREHMPDIPFADDGSLHLGVWRALYRLHLEPGELSVEEHGDFIRRSVAAYERQDQPETAHAA